jgi:hypothetical protein
MNLILQKKYENVDEIKIRFSGAISTVHKQGYSVLDSIVKINGRNCYFISTLLRSNKKSLKIKKGWLTTSLCKKHARITQC